MQFTLLIAAAAALASASPTLSASSTGITFYDGKSYTGEHGAVNSNANACYNLHALSSRASSLAPYANNYCWGYSAFDCEGSYWGFDKAVPDLSTIRWDNKIVSVRCGFEGGAWGKV
ncbi:hypothetical protein NA57DRAFT_80509 [Rhizodiscina lignyota]|uniref:Uncharacterized protein n=1 Tax=Rhizodiscina lignyota TaxID=1504668 RepID=A0A9P4M224_9PEZI|nr:hypothetical protein NA57DRAFT_80509 [Rhizodiscina lignyota]